MIAPRFDQEVSVRPENIRNVVLVGHGGSGKTTLAEAMLHVAGVTTRQGSVDAGTTVFDHEPEEIDRSISLGLSVGSLEWNGHQINLVDTPGYADFAGDARTALRAADLALFVVSAVDGVEVQTELMWRVAGDEGIPRAIVVTKLDRERASFQRTLDQLREVFGKPVAPIQVPIGSETGLRGIVRVVSERAYVYDGGTEGTLVDLPGEVSELVHSTHIALVESVVETDDALMEAYFEGEEPDRDVIVKTVHQGMLSNEIYPVLVTSAATLVGVDKLAEFIIDFGPTPLERTAPPLTAGDLAVSEDGEVAAYVFKTISDPFVGRISMFRVFSGSIPVDAELELERGTRVRMHNLFHMQGKEHHNASVVGLGEIAAVSKADEARAGSTLRSPGSSLVIEPVALPRPVME